jgi:hypothetical protein
MRRAHFLDVADLVFCEWVVWILFVCETSVLRFDLAGRRPG